MKTKVALIGSKEFQDHVQDTIVPYLNEIELVPYVYTEPREAGQLISAILPCDAILFSGALPYFFAKEACSSMAVPILYLEQDEAALVTSLLSILHHHRIQPHRISIDLMDTSFVDHISSDLHLENPPNHVKDYKGRLPHDFTIEEFTVFHSRLYEEGQTELALTSIHAVYDQLTAMNIPSMRMIDPVATLLRTIEEARLRANHYKRKAATVAAAKLIIDEKDEGALHNLHKLSHLIGGTLQETGDTHPYTIYSNRGSIESFLAHPDFASFFQDSDLFLAGFGYGETAAQAVENAETALSFAKNEGSGNVAFVLNEEKELSGPYPSINMKMQLKNTDPDFYKLAKQLKLSPANISKLITFSKSRPSREFTAPELSDYLAITRRSTERLLKKLVDNGAAKITGKEMTYAQGRPRAVYELTFPIY
ncbi:transcriptional regulator [Rossellomorea aquimaris]|uniref:transcriptional regulator n=1 Tax=Rossellomorea aquimaris TaxID=189382 RepID=UPI001CD3694C|nr:transcriptional regulator [Rossellomorea aquimaris]MCA1055975.1 transcriptional regulator [Rossellomorea aquimaris]